MLEALPDTVVGGAFFVVLLAAAVLAGGAVQRSTASRNLRALAALAPMVEGKPEGDHASAWVHGRYRGRAVRVTIVPRKNIGESSETARHINSFEIVLPGVSGGHDWRVSRQGLLRKSWAAASKKEGVHAALSASDLIPRLKAAGGDAMLAYRAAEATLAFHQDVTPRLAPRPDDFRARLDLVIHAAELNDEVNPPPKP